MFIDEKKKALAVKHAQLGLYKTQDEKKAKICKENRAE
jgi:hypothetical protein